MARKLRIFCVLHSLGGGGSEMLTHRIIRGLDANEFEFIITSLVSEGAMAETLRSDVARLLTLGHRQGIRPGLIMKLRRLLHAENPDVVHSHHLAPLLYTRLALASRLKRTPHLHTVHVLPEVHGRFGSLSRKAVWLYSTLLKTVDHVICVSRGERSRLQHVPGLLPARVTAIPNGVDIAKFSPMPPAPDLRKELGLAPETLVITSIGAFRAQKNQKCLIEAFHLLQSHRQDAVLLLAGGPVGDGAELKNSETLTQALNLSEKVRFLGPRSDVAQLLALTDVYVQPSLYEGLPLSVLEAMAMERAVIATDVAGNNELIRHETTGLLVPPALNECRSGLNECRSGRATAQAICEALLRLLCDAPLRRRLGAEARRFVSKGYSETDMIHGYDTLYRIFAGTA